MTHLLSIRDLTREEVYSLFRLAAELKAKRKAGDRATPLSGRTLALVFEKPSLRTRVTFEVGMIHLGGRAIYLSGEEIGLGVRESVLDAARNLGRWVDVVAARTFRHAAVEELARHAGVPVINALSDREHPTEALVDFFTLFEQGMDLRKLKLAWVGDGNNVCHSLILMAGLLGSAITLSTPAGYEPDPAIVATARAWGGRIELVRDPRVAARDADVLYTDVWTSMGQESEAETRRRVFHDYQINRSVLALAKPGARVMHCLPAHRGEEITDEVLDGPQSIVLDQAENRLHAQKAVLLSLLGGGDV
jgi:ornithine carbamoyltransferase